MYTNRPLPIQSAAYPDFQICWLRNLCSFHACLIWLRHLSLLFVSHGGSLRLLLMLQLHLRQLLVLMVLVLLLLVMLVLQLLAYTAQTH